MNLKKQDDKRAKSSGNESNITGADCAFSLLSIMTRLFEFALWGNSGGDNGYITAVSNVVSKQICSVNIQSRDDRRYTISRGEMMHVMRVVQQCLRRVVNENTDQKQATEDTKIGM